MEDSSVKIQYAE